MLQLQNLLFKRGNRVLFDYVDVSIHQNQKVGIVGRNGCGKSTLFELIRSRILPEEGEVFLPNKWSISHLEQSVSPSSMNGLDFVVDGDQKLRAIEKQIRHIDVEKNPEKVAQLYSELDDAGGYQAKARAGEILNGLGFVGEEFNKPHAEFSGGWRIRLNLGRTLMAKSDLLLLDEPTNHLDLDTTIWLERWLSRFEGTLLIISHDRDFLDKTVSQILHINEGRATIYRGNYSSFERQYSDNLMHQESQFKKQELERERIKAFAARFRAKATKAKQVQSRLRALEHLTQVAPIHAGSHYSFSFSNPEKASTPLIDIEKSQLGYEENIVIKDVTLRVYPEDRIGILGMNGAGKSTLLRTIIGEIPIIAGTLIKGKHSHIGYFAQHQLELLNEYKSPLQHYLEKHDCREQDAKNYLGHWGFRGDDINRTVASFSGGEKARLVLALIASDHPAILVFDEPSNHLDIEMREALVLALQEYKGALLLVSHDRHLLRHCVNTFWHIQNQTVTEFKEDLETYTESVIRKQPIQVSTATTSGRQRRQDNARQREILKPLRKRQTELEQLIDTTNHKIKALSERLADPLTYEKESTSNIQELTQKHGHLKKMLEKHEEDWLNIGNEIDLF